MMCDESVEKNVTQALQQAMGDRATWFYLLLKEAKEMGYDYQTMAKRAITKYGQMKGKSFGEIKDAAEFARALISGPVKGALEAEIIECNEDKAVIKFYSCPLVNSWRKNGCSNEEAEELCSLAMAGDFGIIGCFPHLKLEFEQLLSCGDDCCELVITK